MNKVIAILFFLIVRIYSGFVLPLRNLKLDLVTGTSIDDVKNEESITNTISSTEPVPNKELPKNRSDIDEKALYEHAAMKQNNQSERAFIYINQKYKKPSLHQYFRLAQNGPEFSRSFHLPPALPQAFIQRRNEPCKSQPNHIPDLPSYLLPPSFIHKCNVKHPLYVSNLNKIGHSEKSLNFNKPNNMRRDFLELLKSPLVRPADRAKVKVKYDGISGLRFYTSNTKDLSYRVPIRPEHNSKANILVEERKSDTRKTYGFSSYAHHPADQSGGIISRIEDPGFDGELMIHDDPSRFLEKQQYEDKLLDQYLRDALGEQVTSKENEIVSNECSNPDCILHSTKTSSSITHHKGTEKHECKCGRHLELPDNELFAFKNRLERGNKPFNRTIETLLRPSSNIAYFKEILSQNLISKNLNDRLALSTIIKLNSTLYQ